MSDEVKPYNRVRVNVGQSVKGIHTVECTVELLTPSGQAPDVEILSQNIVTLLKTVEQKLVDDKREVARNQSP